MRVKWDLSGAPVDISCTICIICISSCLRITMLIHFLHYAHRVLVKVNFSHLPLSPCSHIRLFPHVLAAAHLYRSSKIVKKCEVYLLKRLTLAICLSSHAIGKRFVLLEEAGHFIEVCKSEEFLQLPQSFLGSNSIKEII